jgi:hypothetical protein
MFRRYATLHGFLTLAAFAVAAVFIGISASQHNSATTSCEHGFFSSTQDPTGASNEEGQIICNIFTWVGLGLLGGLWAVLGIAQVKGHVYRLED